MPPAGVPRGCAWLVAGLSPPWPPSAPLSTGRDLGVGEPPATVCASLQCCGPRETPALGCHCGGPEAWAHPGHHAAQTLGLAGRWRGGGCPGRTEGAAWLLWSETAPGKTWDLQQGTWPVAWLADLRASGRVRLEPRMGCRQAGELPGLGRGGGREKGAALGALGGWRRPIPRCVFSRPPRSAQSAPHTSPCRGKQ